MVVYTFNARKPICPAIICRTTPTTKKGNVFLEAIPLRFICRRRKQNSSHVVEGKYGTNHAKPSAMLLI